MVVTVGGLEFRPWFEGCALSPKASTVSGDSKTDKACNAQAADLKGPGPQAFPRLSNAEKSGTQ